MADYVYCECRTDHSHDLSAPPGQPFPVAVEYDNSTAANAWVHLFVSPFGDLTPIQVNPNSVGSVTFDLPNFTADTTGVTMKAHLRDSNDPTQTAAPLYAEEDQTGIAFYGLGMFAVPTLNIEENAYVTPLGKFYYKRFPPKFREWFLPAVRVQIFGKKLGRSPVLRYDLPGYGTRWTQFKAKWALEYTFVAPSPPTLGAGERAITVALLLDSGGKVQDQTHFNL